MTTRQMRHKDKLTRYRKKNTIFYAQNFAQLSLKDFKAPEATIC